MGWTLFLSGTGDDSGIARYGGLAVAYLSGKRKGYIRRKNSLIHLFLVDLIKKSRPETKFDWLSKNRTTCIRYFHDEHCGFIPTTQFFLDLFTGLGIIHKKSEIEKYRKSLPILLFSGADDPVGNYGKAVWKVAQQYNDVILMM